MNNYDDRQGELEHPYRSDYSSSGLETQRLGASQGISASLPGSSSSPGTLAASLQRNNFVALALIGVGMLMLLSRMGLGQLEIVPGLILLTIASGFLFFALSQRIYGLSIPGFILAGLSVGITFVNITGGASVLWGLALGFLLVYVVGKALFQMRSSWPMIPSVILFCVGCIVAITQLPSFLAAGFIWLPLLLVGAGFYLGWGRRTV